MHGKHHIQGRGGAGRWTVSAAVAGLIAACFLLAACGSKSEPGAPQAKSRGPTSPRIEQTQGILPRYHALVIGISEYARHGAEGWERLATARQDAEAVADLLENGYGFEVRRLLDRDATRGAVIQALDRLVGLTPGDAVLIYFAGHGFYDEALGEGYWIPADARRRRSGADAKEDWIWNTTITKLVGASQARHILIIADACFGGSLFRGSFGNTLENDFHWYARALSTPSRYLITSGDMEPVLDSGSRHSVFAQELLNYLGHPAQEVFSASDIGLALREKVSTLTGQLVRMGPLAVSTHAGGEFVFVSKNAKVDWPSEPPIALVQAHASAAPALERGQRDELLEDALLMSASGATQSATRVVSSLLQTHPDDPLVRSVAEHLDAQRRATELNQVRELISRIGHRGADGTPVSPGPLREARPRVMACIGPDGSKAAGSESFRTLVRICLQSRLQAAGGLYVVERDALQDLLLEMDISSSDLADERARTALGRLLPASLLLLGDIVPEQNGQGIYLRLVDTETSRIVGSFSDRVGADQDLSAVCSDLAGQVLVSARKAKPLQAPCTEVRRDSVAAAIGSFHGADTGMRFVLEKRRYLHAGDPNAFTREMAGTAKVRALGETRSEFTPEWSRPETVASNAELWVRESTE